MTLTEKETKALEIQEFRFSIISEIVNPYLQRGDVEQMIRDTVRENEVFPRVFQDKIMWELWVK